MLPHAKKNGPQASLWCSQGGLFFVVLALCLSACFPKRSEDQASTLFDGTPALATRGPHRVGLETLHLTDPNRNNRPVVVELWYPTGAPETTQTYSIHLGLHDYPFVGHAAPNAAPLANRRFPLVVYSHTQPGERQQLAYALEHLASYGFVVAALDHEGATSTKVNLGSYVSGLVDRPDDVRFALSRLLVRPEVDSTRLGLFGYSYGGYTMFNVAGARLSSDRLERFCTSTPWDVTCLMRGYMSSLVDMGKRGETPRVSALLTLAPFGSPWLETNNVDAPLLVMAGTADQTALYQRDARQYFEGVASGNKTLLSIAGAGHNIFKMCPLEVPAGTYDATECDLGAVRLVQVRQLVQHLSVAFFKTHLEKQQAFLPHMQPNGFNPSPLVKMERRP